MLRPFLVFCMLAASAGQSSFESLSQQAAAARDAKRPDEALALYRKALKLKPSWEEGRFDAGMIAYDLDKYAECAADFHKITAAKPDTVAAWTMAGLCEYRLKDYEGAANSLTHAERLRFDESPELSRNARLHLALVLTKTGNYEKAIVLLLQLTRVDRKTPEIVVAAGIAGLRRPWTPPEVPEGSRDLVFKLGDAMASVMEMDNKTAVEKFALALRDYPKEPNVHFRYGAFLAQEDTERGVGEIKKTLELDPMHIPALVALSAIYLKHEQPEQAREYAEKAVKLSPSEFAPHIALGRVLLQIGEAAGSAKELEAAVRLAPESPEARFSLANAYAELGRRADAAREREEFRRLRKLIDSSQP